MRLPSRVIASSQLATSCLPTRPISSTLHQRGSSSFHQALLSTQSQPTSSSDSNPAVLVSQSQPTTSSSLPSIRFASRIVSSSSIPVPVSSSVPVALTSNQGIHRQAFPATKPTSSCAASAVITSRPSTSSGSSSADPGHKRAGVGTSGRGKTTRSHPNVQRAGGAIEDESDSAQDQEENEDRHHPGRPEDAEGERGFWTDERIYHLFATYGKYKQQMMKATKRKKEIWRTVNKPKSEI